MVSLSRGLPRAVWILQAGLVFNALGNGAAAPFTVIYLHEVRGISLGAAGLAAATSSLAALCAGLAAGAIADRTGPRATLLGGLAVAAVAFACYPLIRTAWDALALAAVAGAGGGAWLTGQASLLAAITPPDRRAAAFAQQRVAANVGLGLGGFAAGSVVNTAHPGTFTLLYVGNALTFAVYGAFLLFVPSARRSRRPGETGGYRAVLRDHAFVRLALLNLAFVAGAISLLNSLAPAYAKSEAGVTERTIGLLFLLNTVFIVVFQIPIARLQEGRRRMRALASMAALFAMSWLLVLFAGVGTGARAAAVVLAVAFVVFGAAECVYDAVVGPLVADLAPEGRTGRYLAVSGFSWQLGFIAGPGLGGFVLGARPSLLWLLAATVCLAAGGQARALERRIPAQHRTTPQARR
ncbi:MAG TPA: MFS transporter [Gaiellaceae bacterium]